MTLALGFKGGILGVGEETEWGTAVARTKFMRLLSEEITVDQPPLESGSLPGNYFDDDDHTLGPVTAGGPAEIEMRYSGMELLFKHAMGSVSTAEVATFEVAAGNKYIDFKEDGGDALLATVETGTVAMGESSATAGTLCAAIKTAMEAAGTGTYTVTFSNTTKKITIAVGGTIAAVQILWKTGTHGSDNADDHIGTLIGYLDTADSASQASHVGDSAVVTIFDHTFTIAAELPIGLSVEVDRDTQGFVLEGAKVTKMDLSLDAVGIMKGNFEFVGEDLVKDDVTTSSLTTAPLIVFSQGAVTYGGSAKSVKNIKLSLDNNLKNDERFVGSRLITEPPENGRKVVTGSMLVRFDSTTEYDDFRAGTSKAITLTCTGATIKTGFTYTLTLTIPIVKLTGGVPKLSGPGPVEMEVPFKAYATDSSTREFNIVLRNILSSV